MGRGDSSLWKLPWRDPLSGKRIHHQIASSVFKSLHTLFIFYNASIIRFIQVYILS